MGRATLAILVLLITGISLPNIALGARHKTVSQRSNSTTAASAQEAAARFISGQALQRAFVAAARDPKTWELAKGSPSGYLKQLGVIIPRGWHVEFSDDNPSGIASKVCSYEVCQSVTACMCGTPCRTCTKYMCTWQQISCAAL